MSLFPLPSLVSLSLSLWVFCVRESVTFAYQFYYIYLIVHISSVTIVALIISWLVEAFSLMFEGSLEQYSLSSWVLKLLITVFIFDNLAEYKIFNSLSL